MPMSILSATLSRLLEANLVGSSLALCWHVGEPLTLPISYYEDSIGVMRDVLPASCTMNLKLQTNGILITDEWCRFFLRHNVQVGISIDGPHQLNDKARVTRSGRGTFDKAVKGLRLLRRHGVDFNVICVLGAASLSQAREIFEFFREESVQRVCFNIEETEGVHRSSLLSKASFLKSFEEFYRAYVSIVEQSSDRQWVREIDNPFEALFVSRHTDVCNHQTTPFSIVTVDWQGGLSTFSPELLGTPAPDFGNFVFGNVVTDSIADMQASKGFERALADIRAGIDACERTCDYFGVCGGGAPSNKFFENGSMASDETVYCRAIIKTTSNVLIERVADR
jgi:uncharacterized protein